jgi:NAD(P)-dependent dehydrogenase (short-subunit alcohol dehydrogenase family)
MATVLITGCSSGYGKRSAQVFLDEGWNVVATMRRPQHHLFCPSERLRVLALDVTNLSSIRNAVDQAIDAFGGIDVLVNNAGVGQFLPLETTPWPIIENVFATNTLGVIAMTRAIIPHMRRRGSGTIINVTSAVTFGPKPLNAVYGASKLAIDGFSEALYHELAPLGVRVKIVEPGYGPQTALTKNTLQADDGSSTTPPYQIHRQGMTSQAGPNFTRDDDVALAVFHCAIGRNAELRTPAGADAIASAERRRSLTKPAFLAKQRERLGLSRR